MTSQPVIEPVHCPNVSYVAPGVWHILGVWCPSCSKMIKPPTLADLAEALAPICGENPRGIRDSHLETVRQVRRALQQMARAENRAAQDGLF